MTEEVLKSGAVIDGRFELERRLGAGAVGVVWSAYDRVEGGPRVALKLLHPRMGNDPGAVEQLEREANVLFQLDHPNIARPSLFMAQGQFVYMVMEFVDGTPLHEEIGVHTRTGQLFSLTDVAFLMASLCEAVAYAHSKRVVHRDLKPHNVILLNTPGGVTAKVLDFGIAKLLARSLFDATTHGRQLGSLFYMSPEQARGMPADERSDVFGLGSIAFELLTLHRAWAWDGAARPLPAFGGPLKASDSNSMPAVFSRIARQPRPSARRHRPELGVKIDEILKRAMAIEADARFQSVQAFGEALVGELRGDRATGRQIEPMTELASQAQLTSIVPSEAQDGSGASIEAGAADSDAAARALEEARPTDKGRIVPQTLLYEGADSHADESLLEDAGATVRATTPEMLAEDAPDTASMENATGTQEPVSQIHSTMPDSEETDFAFESDDRSAAFAPRSPERREDPGAVRVVPASAAAPAKSVRPVPTAKAKISIARNARTHSIPGAEDSEARGNLRLMFFSGVILAALILGLSVALLRERFSNPTDLPPPDEQIVAIDLPKDDVPTEALRARFDPLRAQLKALKKARRNQKLMDGLAEGIIAESALLDDREVGANIAQRARLSAQARAVEPLESALKDLIEAATKQAVRQ